MEQYRSLYKVNGCNISPRNNKRKVAQGIRATKRSEMYSSTRNISLSPSPNRRGNPADEQKENIKPIPPVAPSKLANIREKDSESNSNQPSSKISEKQSRQKAYLLKFLAWKAEKAKQAQLKEQQQKRPPFLVPTGNVAAAVQPKTFNKSFAPKNHVFNPPANLKDLKVEILGANTMRCVNGEQEATYQFVETPKKKRGLEVKTSSVKPVKPASVSTMQILKPVNPKPAVQKTSVPVQKVVSKPAVTKTDVKTRSTTALVAKKVPPVISKPTPSVASSSKMPAPLKSAQKSTVKPAKPPIRHAPLQLAPKSTEKQQNSVSSKTKMPPPSQQVPKITKKTQSSATSASSKTKSGLPALKRPTFKASKKNNSSIFKKSAVPPSFKLNGKSFLQSIVEPNKFTDPVPETPVDLNPTNSYLNFVTSTKRKSSSGKDSNADLLFAELGSTISPVDDCRTTPAEQKSKAKDDKQFQFIRYSVVESDKEGANNPQKAEKPSEAEKIKEAEKSTGEIKSTPDKNCASPTTYMSPYVSVSRGKVSSKIEREKRNSVYLGAENSTSTATPESTATVRRTLATVHYYRKQLTDEIARLNEQCNNWEQYKEANAKLIEDGGVDMISVTIGQTKLLVTKKLKQFSGLIDRCEDGVLGKTATRYGDSEAVKPILPEDLEGFWSMVGLQIDNVDKRFADLERWKANNWTDPDEIPTKAVKAQAAVKKIKKRKPNTTARPNGDLQKMLKTAHAAYLSHKATGNGDEDVILTPSKSRQVLIRDRRSRSAAATVITVNTPKTTRRSSHNESPKLLPHLNNFRKSFNLLKTALMVEHDRKSTTEDYVSPSRHQSTSRKSILKTPGSRSRPKSVVFNSPTLKFTTIEDTVDDASHENREEDQRTYKLRNRRIILRDSAEFVIPK